MPNKQQRMQNANLHREHMRVLGPARPCPNCQWPLRGDNGHFVVPSLGEAGFFICKKVEPSAPSS